MEPPVDAAMRGSDDSAPSVRVLTRADPSGTIATSRSSMESNAEHDSETVEVEEEDDDDDRDERASLVSSSDEEGEDDEELNARRTHHKTRARSRRGRGHTPVRPDTANSSWQQHRPYGYFRRLLGALRPLVCLGEVFMGVAVLVFITFVVIVIPEYGRSSAVGNVSDLRAPYSEICQNWTIANLDGYLDQYRTNFIPSCLDDDSVCNCPNPVIGSMPQDPGWWNMSWQYSNERNQARVQEALDQHRVLDVVLLGDSITEHWHGTDLGDPAENFKGNVKVYDQLFNSPDAPIQGLALGNGGDRTTQLLYRLEHGEVEKLDAPVFWILIGTNDVLGFDCSTDDIVAGILASFRILRQQKPSSYIVLQALLPVSANEEHDLLRWRAYSEINQRLACFAEQAPLVEFVNMTQSFLTQDNEVDISLLVDGLHPGVNGSFVLGGGIVRVVQRLLNAR